jgi:glycosyltransferase involved in cell wall biosynthesis
LLIFWKLQYSDFKKHGQASLMEKSNLAVVSVIIPSYHRPQMASKAVHSALAQTFQSIEVIIVIDGPDPATVDELKLITDDRLQVIELATNMGAAAARNTGIAKAQGTWIAFLDDDDEWLPTKIEQQFALATKSVHAFPIISCRFFGQTSKGKFIWPKRLPNAQDQVADYLFIRKSLFLGEAFIVTPTIFTKKALLDKIPFNPALPRHEDLDWLVRASQEEGVGIEFVPEPLAIVNMIYAKKRKSLSNINDWKYSLHWIQSVRELISPQAYSSFLIAVVGPAAANESDWNAFTFLLQEAIKFGQLRPFDLLLYGLMWFVPQGLRQKLRFLLNRRNRDDTP